MGYYSFYRILKDFFITFFNRKYIKFLLFILIFLIFLFTYKSNVKAISVEYNGSNYDLPDPPSFDDVIQVDNRLNTYPDGYKYIIICYSSYLSRFTLSYINSTELLKFYNGGIYSNDNPMKLLSYQLIDNNWSYIKNSFRSDYAISFDTPLFTNIDILNSDGTIFKPGQSLIKNPEIVNTLNDFETLNLDVISINAWGWSNKDFDVLFYDRNIKDTTSTEGLYPKRVITLNQNTTYYQSGLTADPNKNAIYWIPIDEIGLNLYIGGTYEIRFAERVPLNPPEYGADYYYNYLGEPFSFTISSDVSQNKINAINKEIEDTTNKKYHDETINKIDNINNNINNLNNNINNVNEALTNTTPDSSVSSDIDNSLNFDNQNSGLNNLNNGFFSRLTSMLSNLLGYNLSDDTSVSIPFPNSEKHLILHSKDIHDHVNGAIRVIINAFWIYVFSYYLWKFINKIYISVSSGNILDSFSSSDEAITNNML